jgi:hypothetical protein
MDSFPYRNKREDVVGIVKVMHAGVLVGWIYRTQDDRYFVQAMPNMPIADQKLAGIKPIKYDPNFYRGSNRTTPYRYSGLSRITKWPWSDLAPSFCGPADVTSPRHQ